VVKIKLRQKLSKIKKNKHYFNILVKTAPPYLLFTLLSKTFC